MTASPPAEGAGNVLLLAPDWRSGVEVGASDVQAGARLLVISYSRPAESYVSFLREHAGGWPAGSVVIEVNRTAGTPASADVDVRVRAPDRLTTIGSEAAELLHEWGAAGGSVTVYFDSITALLQYVGVDEAYRFLRPLTREVRAVGARGYFRIAPAAHDDSAIATFGQLFETVTRVDTGNRPTGSPG